MNLSQSDYVDLRFANQIYLGKAEESEIMKKNIIAGLI